MESLVNGVDTGGAEEPQPSAMALVLAHEVQQTQSHGDPGGPPQHRLHRAQMECNSSLGLHN